MRSYLITALPFAALIAWGCLGLTDDIASPEQVVSASLAQHVAGGHYADLVDATSALEAASRALCAAPSEATLGAARDAWWDARGPWKRAEVVLFGPVVEYPERLGPKLDDWPVNARAVEDLIASDASVDDDAFGNMGSATRGFPVVEYLLWDDDALEALTNPRRCQTLMGAAADVHANSALLDTTWDATWVPLLSDPRGTESDYGSAQEVVDEWVNRMAFTLENIRTTKLGVPAGDDAGGLPQPDTLESRPSGRSIEDARDALAGVEDIWTGEVDEGRVGVRDLLIDEELVASVEASFLSTHAAVEAIPEPLERAIVEDRAAIQLAQAELQALQVLIQTEVASAIGVRLAFNDADGD